MLHCFHEWIDLQSILGSLDQTTEIIIHDLQFADKISIAMTTKLVNMILQATTIVERDQDNLRLTPDALLAFLIWLYRYGTMKYFRSFSM